MINSLSTDTNNKITNDDWNNEDKYEINAYDASLTKSTGYTDLGIGPGEKYVRLNMKHNNGQGGTLQLGTPKFVMKMALVVS